MIMNIVFVIGMIAIVAIGVPICNYYDRKKDEEEMKMIRSEMKQSYKIYREENRNFVEFVKEQREKELKEKKNRKDDGGTWVSILHD